MKKWRPETGYLLENSNIETASILLGRFLNDRGEHYPLPEKDLFTDGKFAWGSPPLEKVVTSASDLDYLVNNPRLYGNSVCIIEPWDHVGFHPDGTPVRASENIAYIAQKIADCGSILFPIWQLGVKDIRKIIEIVSRSPLFVFEGGHASVDKPEEWAHHSCSLDDMLFLVETLLQWRGQRSASGLFICVGHQLVAECLINILKRVCNFVPLVDQLPNDHSGEVLRGIKNIAGKIQEVGQSLRIRKRNGDVVANSWEDPNFAISNMKRSEVGNTFIRPYVPPLNSGLDREIINAQFMIHEELETILDQMMRLRYEAVVDVAMFHSQEVSENAMLFANWAYNKLHDCLHPHRSVIATSPLAWLLKLPYAVKIIAFTESGQEIMTECASMCVAYKDHETRQIRRNFTIQFHPELLSDLHSFGQRAAPGYAELQQADSVRLLVRLIYLGLHN